MLMVLRSMTRRAFAALSGTVALLAFGLAGCSSQGDSPGTGVGGTVAFSSQPEERGLMGPLDACDVRVGLIMGPPSMGLLQFILAAQNDRTSNGFENTDVVLRLKGLAEPIQHLAPLTSSGIMSSLRVCSTTFIRSSSLIRGFALTSPTRPKRTTQNIS